jgi:UDP:flavonoid glycosyltransferase YjiC (YdhE family)
MAHIHLCWELGGGLGHAGRLKMLAQALLARGHQVSLSLRDLMHTNALLADLDVPKLQAPVWLHQAVGLPSPPGSLAEILLHCGYLEPAALRGMVAGWRAMFELLRPDLVVADFAPTAILAARVMGLRSASMGNGFYSPPPGRPLPPLRGAPAERLAASEARVLRTANALLAGRPLQHAVELLLGDLPLLCTWPELDHYGRADADAVHWFGPSFLPDAGGTMPPWPQGAGRKVFAYLKAGHPSHAAVLRALAEEGCHTLVYMPEVAGGAPAPVTSPLLHYLSGPVALSQALAEVDLCVSHAGEATLAQSLLAGVPLLMLPSHAEQFMTARRVALSGAGYNAALMTPSSDWRGALRQVLDDGRYRQAARAVAARHQGFSQQRMNAELAELLERQLACA